MKPLKLGLIIGLVTILLVSSVLAWSYIKVGSTYVLTLDSGKVVNVTDVHINNADKTLNAVVHTDKLTIQEVVNLKNITETIIASLPGKKDEYNRNVLVIQK